MKDNRWTKHCKEKEEIKRTTMQKMARQHNKEGGNHMKQESNRQKTSSSRSSDGNPSLLDEGGSASQVPQLAGYGSVVWPDSLPEWLVGGAGLQWMFCCLTASTARALLCMANAEFGIQDRNNVRH